MAPGVASGTTNGTTNGSANGGSVESETVPLLIGGKDVTTQTTFIVDSPLGKGKPLYECSSAGVAEAMSAVAAAEKAFPAWSRTKPPTRRDILLKAADIFVEKKEEMWELWHQETGAERDFYETYIFRVAVEGIRDTAGKIADAVTASVPVIGPPNSSAIVYKEPYGVVLGISPWNAPIVLGLRAFLFPIAAGNTVVLKGSEQCPKTFLLQAQYFSQAGLPDGVLNVIYSQLSVAREVTEALIAHPVIKKINFTGSTAVGSSIASVAGKYLKPVLMELGGKAPAIVLDDAEVENAAALCVKGAFLNYGQICMSTERIIVQKGILPKFRAAIQNVLSKTPYTNASVLIVSAAVSKNKKLISDALSKGAQVIAASSDIQRAPEDDLPSTSMYPTVIEQVNKDMDIYYTESFGATVSLIVVETEDEAIELANDTDYGLSAAIFTEDLRRGLRLAKQIETGAVHINDMSVHDEAPLPHGGAKKSGWGRFNGRMGLDEFLRTKSVTWKD